MATPDSKLSDTVSSDQSVSRSVSRSVSQSADKRMHSVSKSAAFMEIRESIKRTLSELREKQRSLKQMRDSDYDTDIAQQYIRRLSGLHSEVQKLVDAVSLTETDAISEIQSETAQAQTRIRKLAMWSASEGALLNKNALKKTLKENLLYLQLILNNVSIELEESDSYQSSVVEEKDTIRTLSAAIEAEKNRIDVSGLGQSKKAQLTEQLHLLALQIHRFRQLTTEPRLHKRFEKFKAITLQIEDAVVELEMEADNAAEIVSSTTYMLERQLCQLEFNRKLLIVPLPFGWLANRYRYATRLKSVQTRVLSGLGLTLLLSGMTFVFLMLILTLISAIASSSIEAQKDNLITDFEEFLNKKLVSEIDPFLKQKEEIMNKESEIQTTQALLDAEKDKLRSLRGENTLGESSAPTQIDVQQIEEIARLEDRLENQTLAQEELNEAYTQLRSRREDAFVDMKAQLEHIKDLKAGIAELEDNRAAVDSSSISTTLTAQTSTTRSGAIDRIMEVFGQAAYGIANFVNEQELLNHSRRILLAAFSGAVGSMMSILIRLDQIDRENIRNPFLLGALKPLIGAIFGVLVFAILSTQVVDILPSNFHLAEKTGREDSSVDDSTSESQEDVTQNSRDPLGNLDSQELYKIFLVAFIAGFSERLASDTLRSVGSKGPLL